MSRTFARRTSVEVCEPRTLLATASPLAPIAVSLELNPLADPANVGVVTTSTVAVEGQTAPGAVVRLFDGSRFLGQTVAGRSGAYSRTVAIPTGTSTLSAEAETRNGSGVATLAVTRANAVVAWNSVALQAIRASKAAAPDSARELAIVEASVYDAVDAINPTHALYAIAQPKVSKGTSPDAAADVAAEAALAGLFPKFAPTFQAELNATLAAVPNGRGKAAGAALGVSVADEILGVRANDGSAVKVNYVPGTAPGQWRPTPPTYSPAVDPQWGQVTPFVLTSGAQFQPPAPPAINSPAYAAAYAQVMSIGSADSTTRTPDETAAAKFWSDLSGTFDPPGHWNQIAEIAAINTHATVASSARTFALLDFALADAGIEAWGVKYTDSTWRPVTAIRSNDGGVNPLTVGDPNWTPLWSTPAFPSYISGHSTFSAAAAAVLDSAYGSNYAFTDPGDPTESLTPRHFASFDQAAAEAGMSRIWGGIHFEFDNTAGLQVGGEVGQYVVAHALPAVSSGK